MAKFVAAYGPWRLFLRGGGYRAITMPWRTIYVLREHIDCEALRRHELVHIEQIQRDGALKFSLRYLWYLARYGADADLDQQARNCKTGTPTNWYGHEMGSCAGLANG